MVVCTLEMGSFPLISEGYLIIQTFKKPNFSLKILDPKSKFLIKKIFRAWKKWPVSAGTAFVKLLL
jgi:hypothetical protein